ncbi:MAG: DUF1566 domain-containing protein [Planctomycetes bacterium]|nr:DUF1566 domain-containing protein [Planctomycetota bacterium]
MKLKRGIMQLWIMAVFIAITGFSGITFATEVIVDNDDSGSTPSGVWTPSGGTPFYGTKSEYSKDPAGTYTYEDSITGILGVSLWWTQWPSRCTNVEVNIFDGPDLEATYPVNQQVNGGQWNLIGEYDFTTSAKVVINAQGSSCSTNADAVKFATCDVDLEVTSVNYTPANPQVGLLATVAVTVRNNGCGEAVDFNIKWWNNGTGPAPDMNEAVTSLAGGASITKEMEWTFPVVDCYDTVAKVTDTNPLSDNDLSNNRMDKTICLGQCPSLPASGVIDNDDAGATSSGNWYPSNGQDPWGSGSEYSRDAAATYEFCASDVTGDKVVSVWYTDMASRCSDVHVVLFDNGTYLDTHILDQTSGGGAWTVLDQHTFHGEAKVVVESSGSGCSTSADAVIFTDGDPPPPDPTSYPAPVPQTKQEATFYPNDDGELQMGVAWPNPRFTKNGNGTVKDNLTGLIWTEDADIVPAKATWTEAMDACAALTDGMNGLTDNSVAGDWRLPNVRELQSLIDYGVSGPAVPDTSGAGKWITGDPFAGVQSDFYWSSTTLASSTTSAWDVSLDGGIVSISNKANLSKHIWCVRGGN